MAGLKAGERACKAIEAQGGKIYEASKVSEEAVQIELRKIINAEIYAIVDAMADFAARAAPKAD